MGVLSQAALLASARIEAKRAARRAFGLTLQASTPSDKLAAAQAFLEGMAAIQRVATEQNQTITVTIHVPPMPDEPTAIDADAANPIADAMARETCPWHGGPCSDIARSVHGHD